MKTTTLYPFCAIVGQEQMKTALLLNLINPKIGGVLIRGEKGTAKSTIVRGLSQLSDGLQVVDLPLGTSEDKLIGSFDLEHIMREGERQFEPGILSKAHGNILYVDEVNLLEDHLVDLLLDVAAMGVNIVEREGISYSHPSEFMLIGTMNPEEGDLRPQLLDRFGLTIEVTHEQELKNRTAIIKRRIAYEQDTALFAEEYRHETAQLSETIRQARLLLPEVVCPEQLFELIARITLQTGVEGHRADIVILKTAITIAAYYGMREVTAQHIYEAAIFALPHRMKRLPFEDRLFSAANLQAIIEASKGEENE